MTFNDIPPDSLLRRWCRYLLTTEVPFSYQVAGGLSVLGTVLRRNRWIDQFEWRVYPNQSVLFIGPSGVGKDTIINRLQRSLNKVEWLSHVPTIGGVTMENIHARLAELPKPAAAYIPAPELTAFFGKADYQANMLTGMTNLLSNGEKIDITTKGELFRHPGGKFVWEPTVTMHGGSTVEWLHKSMPDGTLEGGFLGRFLIVCEELGSRHIPLIKSDKSREELSAYKADLEAWNQGIEDLIKECTKPREVIIFDEAEAMYGNWYHNRFKYFSRAVMPYANRSRDMVLRLAMLSAFSRQHYRWVEAVDIEFAIKIITDVAHKIDNVVLPPTREALVAQQILNHLPALQGEIYHHLANRFTTKMLEDGFDLLRKTGRIVTGRDMIIRPTEPTPPEEN